MHNMLLKMFSVVSLLSVLGCAKTAGTIKAEIEFLEKQKDLARTEQDEFESLPLVPGLLKEWKRDKWIPMRIRDLNGKLYKAVILKRIHIKSKGTWDPIAPEILVKTEGNAKIARGEEDNDKADFFFSQGIDVTGSSKLGVYDDDISELEFMGWISLNVEDIPIGVAGDSITRRVEGSDESSGQGKISYVVEYEVRY